MDRRPEHQAKGSITIPKWLYETMVTDSKLVRWLTKCRGIGWIEQVKKEMELEEKYHPKNDFKFETILKKQRDLKWSKAINKNRYIPTLSNDGKHVSTYVLRDKVTGRFVSKILKKVNKNV